jgi:hypothetical protein
VIEVSASSTVADFESALAEVAAAPADADLLLTRKQKWRFVAGTAAQLQLLATWRHSCPQGRVRIHAHAGMEPAEYDRVLENFVETDRGAIAASVADVWTRAGDRDLSDRAREIADLRLAALQADSGHIQGRRVLGLCLDESPFEAPEGFYFPKQPGTTATLRSLEDFRSFARDTLARIWLGAGSSGIDPLRKPDPDALGELFFELFDNTDHWARKDAGGNTYPRRSSTRGIRIEGHGFDQSEEATMAAAQPALAAFLARPAMTLRDGRHRLVEATIFDSGPGIAAREMRTMERTKGSEPDVAEEQTALLRCLEKHFTHDRSGRRRGIGLHAAMGALSHLKAFLWIRSGRLSLYRDFIEMPYDPAQKGREPYLVDWESGGSNATQMAPSQGSFITALIPITQDSEQTLIEIAHDSEQTSI